MVLLTRSKNLGPIRLIVISTKWYSTKKVPANLPQGLCQKLSRTEEFSIIFLAWITLESINFAHKLRAQQIGN